MASSTRAAPAWSSILLAFLIWAYVEAKPSIPMDYCSSINTASMAASALPRPFAEISRRTDRTDQNRRPQYLPVRRAMLWLLRGRLCPRHRPGRLVLVLEFRAQPGRSGRHQPVQQSVPWLSRRRVWRRWPVRIHAAADSALRHRRRPVVVDHYLLSMYTLCCPCVPKCFISAFSSACALLASAVGDGRIEQPRGTFIFNYRLRNQAQVTTTEIVQSTVTYIPPSSSTTSSDSSATSSSVWFSLLWVASWGILIL